MDARCLDMTACLAVITHYRSARGNAASPKNASHNGDELFPPTRPSRPSAREVRIATGCETTFSLPATTPSSRALPPIARRHRRRDRHATMASITDFVATDEQGHEISGTGVEYTPPPRSMAAPSAALAGVVLARTKGGARQRVRSTDHGWTWQHNNADNGWKLFSLHHSRERVC